MEKAVSDARCTVCSILNSVLNSNSSIILVLALLYIRGILQRNLKVGE